MKDYIVTVDCCDWNNLFIISAHDAKNAIDKIWDKVFKDCVESDKAKGFVPVWKKDLSARSIDSLYKESDRNGIICLN